MLYFKIILALLLSAIPFLFKHFILPKRESSPACRNAITAAASAMPYFKRWRRKYFNISIRIYNAMKHSIEARKFFTLLMLLVLLTITMVDFSASATIARKVTKAAQECGDETETLIGLYSAYAPYLTFRYATVLAGLMVVPFFLLQADGQDSHEACRKQTLLLYRQCACVGLACHLCFLLLRTELRQHRDPIRHPGCSINISQIPTDNCTSTCRFQGYAGQTL